MGRYYGKDFQGREIAIIKKLVKEFQKRWKCLEQEDFDDLFQECIIHWCISKDHYEPGREASQKSYMGHVIRNKLMDLVLEKETGKRKTAYLGLPFDEPFNSESLTQIDEIKEISAANTFNNRFQEVQIKMDLSSVLQELTPYQQDLCQLLGEEGLTRRKVFISYHHGDDIEVKDFVKRWTETEKVFIPKGLGLTFEDDIIDSDNPEYVMSQIRKRYLEDCDYRTSGYLHSYVLRLLRAEKPGEIIKDSDALSVQDMHLTGKYKILEALRKSNQSAYFYWALAVGVKS